MCVKEYVANIIQPSFLSTFLTKNDTGYKILRDYLKI
jgi:hypothetical protein